MKNYAKKGEGTKQGKKEKRKRKKREREKEEGKRQNNREGEPDSSFKADNSTSLPENVIRIYPRQLRSAESLLNPAAGRNRAQD